MTSQSAETTERYWNAVKTLRSSQITPTQHRDALEEIASIGLNHVECRVGTLARETMLRRHGVVVDINGHARNRRRHDKETS